MISGKTVKTGRLVGTIKLSIPISLHGEIKTEHGVLSGKTVKTGRLIGKTRLSVPITLRGALKPERDVVTGEVNKYISSGDADIYTGEYIVTPIPYDEQILETREKLMINDVTVLAIPYFETSNIADGLTVYIGD